MQRGCACTCVYAPLLWLCGTIRFTCTEGTKWIRASSSLSSYLQYAMGDNATAREWTGRSEAYRSRTHKYIRSSISIYCQRSNIFCYHYYYYCLICGGRVANSIFFCGAVHCASLSNEPGSFRVVTRWAVVKYLANLCGKPLRFCLCCGLFCILPRTQRCIISNEH